MRTPGRVGLGNVKRLASFNALLAKVNRTAAYAADEKALLYDVCRLAVQQVGVGLVWVGVPDEAGTVEIVASAGATDYLKDLPLSVRADRPDGLGPTGRAWRTGRPQYVRAIQRTQAMAAWHERAARFGLTGAVALPLERNGRPWGVLSVYLRGTWHFGSDVRLLLEEVARAMALGLDRLESDERGRQLLVTQDLLLENTYAGITMTREGVLVVANRHLEDMLGRAVGESLVGQPWPVLAAEKKSRRRLEEALLEVAGTEVVTVTDVRLSSSRGEVIFCDITMHRVDHRGVQTVVWTLQDVTARYMLERELEDRAYHDVLTGLPNRRALDLELPRAVARAARKGTSLVVGMVDLDDFKAVNDSLGHDAGDRVLTEVGRRLKDHLRTSDFVARPGGDEFVVLLEDFERPCTAGELHRSLARLAGVMDQPLEAAPGQLFPAEISLGLAVFPQDGEFGEELLRKADGALYELKAHKLDRSKWWRLASEPSEEPGDLDVRIDAYDDEASRVLAGLSEDLAQVATRWVDTFHARMGHDSDGRRILESLDDEFVGGVKEAHARHMMSVLAPEATPQGVRESAERLGEIQALVGVGSTWIGRGIALYRELLTEQLNEALLSSRERYRVLLLAEQRLQDELDGAILGMQATTAAYLDALARPLPAGVRWVDSSQAELRRLAGLPGVVAVLLCRLNAEGDLTIESWTGRDTERLDPAIGQAGVKLGLSDLASPLAGPLRDGQIVSSSDFPGDRRFARWEQEARALQVRSFLAVPLLDEAGHGIGGVCILGRYPNQFESPAMRQFAQSTMHRWEGLWRRSVVPAPVLPHNVARAMREHLFGEGLRMFVQPMVDLRTGRLVRVEALARLVQPGGRVLPPTRFLPLLGNAELGRLFRQGLDQSLGHLATWEGQGLEVGISVNLPPATLLLPECDRWVAEALSKHGTAPSRLTLELLETQRIDEASRDGAIARLLALGVRLAIDDLGAGYSSLARLSTLPFHMVKIDQALVRHLSDEPLSTLVVLDTLTEMGRRLGRVVVVEGLASRGAVEAAALIGSPWGQGHGLARPMPAADLPGWHRSFALPIEPGRAHTFLGALAHHWKFGHQMAIDACPLTGLIEEKGLQDTDRALWHSQAHAAKDDPEAEEHLTAWLLKAAREERF